MFCDMKGFTPLVEKLGPEEAYGIMDQVYEILIQKVHDYEGTVNEMTGDGLWPFLELPLLWKTLLSVHFVLPLLSTVRLPSSIGKGKG